MVARSAILDSARSWLGTPYRHQARRKGIAIDCIGLIWGVAADIGYDLKIPANYGRNPSTQKLIKGCHDLLIHVERTPETLRIGDIAVIWGQTRGEAQHFAIMGHYGGRTTMIHAFSKHMRVVEQGWDPFWHPRFVAAFNYPSTED